jgi:hypothetical protein
MPRRAGGYVRELLVAVCCAGCAMVGCDETAIESKAKKQAAITLSLKDEGLSARSGGLSAATQPKSTNRNKVDKKGAPQPSAPKRAQKKSPRAGYYSLAAVTRTGQPTELEVQERGCRVLDLLPVRIAEQPGPVSIVAAEGAFIAATYSRARQGEELSVSALTPLGPPRVLKKVRLSNPLSFQRVARPGLTIRDKTQAFFATVDGSGSVQVGTVGVQPSDGQQWLERVAEGADPRFAPALAVVKNLLAVAWTVPLTPTITKIVLLNDRGRQVKEYDVSPPAMGASAPVFVAGSNPPVLMVVDARDGYSPVVRVPLNSEGVPGPPVITTPVSMVFDPPELSAASGSAGTYLVYTGMGGGATTALGLVTLHPKPSAPLALVKGTTYGMLYVAGTSAPRAPVFAVDVPQKPGVHAAREVQVQVIDERGPGPSVTVRGPDGEAAGAALARDPKGLLAVAFQSPSGVYVAWVRCDDE